MKKLELPAAFNDKRGMADSSDDEIESESSCSGEDLHQGGTLGIDKRSSEYRSAADGAGSAAKDDANALFEFRNDLVRQFSASTSDGPSVSIYFNGEDITDDSVDVWVGEYINLGIVLDPRDATVDEVKWEFPDDEDSDKVQDFVTQPKHGQSYPFDASQESKKTIHYYWVTGTAAGVDRGVKVTVKVTIGGVQSTLDADTTFNVKRPDLTFNGFYVASVAVPFQIGNAVILDIGGKMEVLNATSPPDEGSVTWVQTGTSLVSVWNTADQMTQVNQTGVDGEFPYKAKNASGYPADDPGTTGISSLDFHKIEMSMSFNMYMMFKSNKSHSIWIPMAVGQWAMHAGGEFYPLTGTWTTSGISDQQPISVSNTNDFPQWWSAIDNDKTRFK